MKPSFAELIRKESSGVLTRRTGIYFQKPGDFNDISNYRKSIITDLEDPKTEFNYLIAFLKICEKKFRTNRKNEDDRIIFLSTAYNYGIDKSESQILSMINKKFFTTKLINSETYCYSDISLYYFRQVSIK